MCTRQRLHKQRCVCVFGVRRKEREPDTHIKNKTSLPINFSLLHVHCSFIKPSGFLNGNWFSSLTKVGLYLNHNCHCKTLLVHFNWPSAKNVFGFFEMSSISYLHFLNNEFEQWLKDFDLALTFIFKYQKMLSIINVMPVNSQAVNFFVGGNSYS